MLTDKNPAESDGGQDVSGLAQEIDAVGKAAARRIDPGPRGFLIAVLVFAVIVAQLLPWVGESAGWQVLFYGIDGAIPRLFAVTSAGFGIVVAALTLITRRWWLSWVCAIGSCIAAIDGLLAIWSQQSAGSTGEEGAGPGIGMIIALIAMFLLAVNWLRTAWSRME